MFNIFDLLNHSWFDKCEPVDARLMKLSQHAADWLADRTGRSNFDVAYLCAAVGFMALASLAADKLDVSDPFSSIQFNLLLMADFVIYGWLLWRLMKLQERLRPKLNGAQKNPMHDYHPVGKCRILFFLCVNVIVFYTVLNYAFGSGMTWKVAVWAVSFALFLYFASCMPRLDRPQYARARRRATA